MKKLYLFILLLFISFNSRSQTAASYTFAAFSSVYTSISAIGTPVPSLLFDDISQLNIPIGFTFDFCGTNYTQLSACANGFLSLSNSSTTTYMNTSGNVVGPGMLMAYWDDLYGDATLYGCAAVSHAYYTTTGTAPNRVFTFEWKDFQAYPWASACICCTINFQVKLYESTNVIDFVYGPSTYSGMSASIGIANSISDWQSLPGPGATVAPSSSLFTSSIATAPASGQVYRWSNQCSGMPVAGGVSATVLSGCTAYTSVLSLPYAPSSSGLLYQWQSSPNGVTWTSITGATNDSYTASVIANTWYRCALTCIYSGLSDTSSSFELFFSSPPAAITGPAAVCAGANIALTDPTAGGSWTSSNLTVAVVGLSSGIVTGVSPGPVSIQYTLPGGCSTVTTLTVLPAPTVISGASMVCTGAVTALGDGTVGGIWTSSASAIAAVDSFSGVVSGVTPGVTTITYTIGSCRAFTAMSVNSSPAAVSGPAAVCIGSSITLHDPSTGGSWNSGNAAIAVVGSSSGIVSGIATGGVSIYYTLSGGCAAAYNITVNPLPSTVTGSSSVCVGQSVPLFCSGTGTWSSSNIAIAKVGTSSGLVTGIAAGNVRITYTLPTGCFSVFPMTVNPLPMPITGIAALCVGANNILNDASTGGTWAAATSGYIAINPLSGLDTGIAAGIVVVSYTLGTGCFTTKVMTVNPVPVAIAGLSRVCVGAATPLFSSSGGVWASGNPTIASVDTTGLVSGLSPGNATISYTFPTGCSSVRIATVIASPAAITGFASVCEGSTTILSDGTPGGTWSSYAANVSVNSASGIVTGITAGTALVSYVSITSGCFVTATVTVNPIPPPVSGPLALCVGSSFVETDSIAGGTWTSSNPAVAAIGSATGLLTGIAIGSTAITYVSPAGCRTTSMVTVTPAPSSILGASTVCVAATTLLSDAITGGVWSSSTAAATINSLTGIVTGVAAGTATISYSLGPGCTAAKAMTVVAAPAPITGTANVCVGAATTLRDTTTGGRWGSGNILIATVGSATGIVSGLAGGIVMITYTSPAGCRALAAVTVNSNPAGITGPGMVCTGSSVTETDISPGGLWSTSSATISVGPTTGIVSGISAGPALITYSIGGCITTATLTVNTMSPITGASGICTGLTTTLHDSTPGGSWSSSNPPVANIGAASGIVTGLVAGTAIITYNVSPGCAVTTTVNVNTGPSSISGSRNICIGYAHTLGNAAPGGTWTSSNTSIATIGSSTGLLSGIATGNTNITYSLGTGCTAIAVITVNPIPSAITGPSQVCIGASATLHDTTAGGAWSSSNPAAAAVGASGLVYGAGIGTSVISYTVSGCAATKGVTISPLPSPVSGPQKVCVGATITLTDIPAGGVWSSNSLFLASVDSVTGVVTGNSAGLVTISYSPGIGCAATKIVTVNALPAGISGSAGLCQGSTASLADVTPGGTWSSSTPSVATVTSSGMVTGASGGPATITYTIPTGCAITHMVSVIVVPPIMGITNLCAWGDTINISDSSVSGSYTSSSVTVLNLGGGAGTITTHAPGPASITYTIVGFGCSLTQALTVNPLPGPISGSNRICQGYTSSYSDITPGGAWSSTNATVAVINPASGLATAMAPGSTLIFYKLPTGCHVDTVVNVLSVPAPITGSSQGCVGASTVLADASTGGIWTSSNLAVANIDTTGIVAAVAAGSATITYTTAPSCVSVHTFTVNALPLVYPVTGGGNYCSGGAGLHIGLGGSQAGVHYQLYRGTTAIGAPIIGSGSSIDFGLQTAAGTYTVVADNTLTGCTNNMGGSVSVSVTPSVLPAVTVTAIPGSTVCVGALTTFNAAVVNGGSTPLYQWFINGVAVGLGASYAYIPSNGDVVRVLLTSNATCIAPDTASDAVLMDVSEMLVPSVTISAAPGLSIITGQYDTLTAVVTGGGSYPAYQWQLNSIPVPGETNATFISNSLINGDIVSCLVTSTGPCGGFSGSNQVTLTVTIDKSAVSQHNRFGETITITPNPNKGEFTIAGTIGSIDEDATIEITDMLGRVVYSGKVMAKAGRLKEKIFLSKSVANGVYLLTLYAGDERKTFHIALEQ
jgi:trimeric autotransporter adhesin